MTRKKDPSTRRKNDLLDELLQGVEDPEDLFGKEGLLKQLEVDPKNWTVA